MTDQHADPVNEFVSSKIARYEKVVVHAPDRRGRMRPKTSYRKVKSGWTPIDALTWAADRDLVTVFRECVMLVKLCGDEKARAMPEHALIHKAAGLRECVGPQLLVRTADSLGISDDRAAYLVRQLEQESAVADGLVGGE
jgi:hypothetical protein